MPKAKETSNHPCHFLSLPSAKRFWCRHCMSVFEDAITRWRHSRSCRYGVVNNFMRRRQLEAKALQNTTKPNPIEARLEQSVSPSEEPIVEEVPGPSSLSLTPSTSAVKTNQATSNDLFRCFICHNKFSTLEEMRHHVKYPCNNKKIVTDVPNPAVTVYIDEFTDRSRQWEPQPQTEEVVTSEFMPNIVSQETVQNDVKDTAIQEGSSSVNIPPGSHGGSGITPTNIYVNEQGETVIEVENLDLNSEGGELSLAHLLTQLSQQGIVFDKTKASQMQAHHEVTTVSDPESGEVYATGTTYDPSAREPIIVKDEDESQSTAEDAANTLAQLAVFRGGYNRNNPEVVTAVPQVSISTDLQRQYVVEGGVTEGYTYAGYAMPSIASAANVHQLDMSSENQPNIKVEYQYDYLPAGHPVTANVSTAPQISIQSTGILEQSSATAHHISNMEVVQSDISDITNEPQTVPATVHIQQDPMQTQVVTYITPSSSSSTIQHVQELQGETETMMLGDFVVEHQGSQQQQYSQDEHEQVHTHISVAADGTVQSEESHSHIHREQQPPHQHSNIPAHLLEAGQNSYIVFNTEDNSTQIICDSDPQANENDISATVESGSVPGSSIVKHDIIETHLTEQQQLQEQNVQETEIRHHVGEIKEFEVQTVTLQEIADTGTNDSVTFTAQNHTNVSTEPTSVDTSIIVSSSNDDNHTNSTLHSTQTIDGVQLEIYQQAANKSLIPVSSVASIATVAVDQQHQQPLCQIEERTVSLESETAEPMPMYVVSPQGDLQLVTSSNDLAPQPQQQEQSFQTQ